MVTQMFGSFPDDVLAKFYASYGEDTEEKPPQPAEKPTKASGMPKPKLGGGGGGAAADPTAYDPAKDAVKVLASKAMKPDKQAALNALGKKILAQG